MSISTKYPSSKFIRKYGIQYGKMLNQTESDRLQTYHALNGIRVANINIYICESAQFVSRLKTLGGILICTLWSRFGFSILNLKCSTRKKHHLIILFIGSDPFCTPAVHLHKLQIWFDYIKRTKAGRAGAAASSLILKAPIFGQPFLEPSPRTQTCSQVISMKSYLQYFLLTKLHFLQTKMF